VDLGAAVVADEHRLKCVQTPVTHRWCGTTDRQQPHAARTSSVAAIPMSGSVSGQRSNDGGERVGRAGAEDEVGEADLLPSPLDFLGCGRRVSGEDGQ
jgi:hypothetical protein